MAQESVAFPKRSEIYLVQFDPAIGSEIRKTRPALVVQNDLGNRFSSTVIVAAIISKGDADEPYPTEVLVRAREGGFSKDSVIRLAQIRTVDKRRLVRRLGSVSPATMARVNRAIEISLALVDV
jgi:mRNA interferase MazF